MPVNWMRKRSHRSKSACKRATFSFWTQHTIPLLGWLLASLPIAGLLYQVLASLMDALRYPPPGKMVDVGGYRLHLYRMGKRHVAGTPTVLLEAGHGSTSLDWCIVQPEIAKYTLVYAYDRAGYGWSETGPLPRTSQQIVEELHRLLLNAAIAGPYVLVGHSFGGSIVCQYAATYPDEVAGLVLVDPLPEGYVFSLTPRMRQRAKRLMKLFAVARILALFGVVRLLMTTRLYPLPQGYTPTARAIVKAHRSQTRYLAAVNAETAAAWREPVRGQRSYGELPLVVLTADTVADFTSQEAQQWRAFHQSLANSSSRGRLEVVKGSGHYMVLERPEAVVHAACSLLTQQPS